MGLARGREARPVPEVRGLVWEYRGPERGLDRLVAILECSEDLIRSTVAQIAEHTDPDEDLAVECRRVLAALDSP